jgi:small subunit ribosomal protein S19e
LTNVHDVPANILIKEIANDLKNNKKVKIPEYAMFVKTGCSRERAPHDPDWWYVRMAAILRKSYVNGFVTVEKLRTYFGGKKNRGVRPEKFKKASGKIIRDCLQDLEKLELVLKIEKKGRTISPKGQKYIDLMCKEILKNGLDSYKTKKEEKIKEPVKEKTNTKETAKKNK